MDVIKLTDIHKSFKLYFDKSPTLKEKIIFKNRNRHELHHVLNGISFAVKKGEAVGLIGENGCGKSTTLKLLSKIIYPDSGKLEIYGKVSSLLELGAGFHPDMTGRENIYMNASIFGLTRKEIDQRLKDIIEFSELGEYIDNRVRTYSSGMYMRLAFSVAINVNADILLIDEILAVGDANFQAKCFSKLREIKASGTTIVIVSHSLTQIEQICDRSIWLKDGLVYQAGAPRDVHIQYLDYMGQKRYDTEKNSQPQEEETVSDNDKNTVSEKDEHTASDNELSESVNEMPPAEKRLRWGSGDAKIISVKLFDRDGNEKYTFKTGEPMRIQISYKSKNNLEKPAIGIGIFRNDGLQCFGTNTQIDGVNDIHLSNQGVINCHIEHNTLIEGDFLLDIAIHTEDGFAYDYYKEAKCFKMYGTVNDVGVVHLDHKWEIN